MTNTKTSEESLNNFQEQKESVQNSENNENDIIKSVENEDDNPLKDSHENILMSFIDMRKTIQSKTSAEQQLLMMIVGQMQKLEKDVQTERSERMRLEKEIKDRNVTDDEQLAHLTKTVDTLLYNLQGYESSAIAREDDNELERANQAKRRSLAKKKKLKEEFRMKEQEAKAAEPVEAAEKAVELKTEVAELEMIEKKDTNKDNDNEDGDGDDDDDDDEDDETKAAKVAFANAKALSEEQDRLEDLKREEKLKEMSDNNSDKSAAKRWYAASIIQVAYRHYLHMKIWKSAVDFGRERVKDGQGITARIGKLEKIVIDLNAYRQRQEEELLKAQKLALELKKKSKYGNEALEQVIEKIENSLEGKTSKADTVNLVKSVEINVQTVNDVIKEQENIREEMKLQHELKQKEGMNNVKEQLDIAKQELMNGIKILEKSSLLATTENQTKMNELKKELILVQEEQVSLSEALGMATKEDPKAINADNLNEMLNSLENKMEAIRDTKLGNDELEEKMKPLVEKFNKVNGSLSNLQNANNKVKESTMINQQKLASEAKKTMELSKNINELKKLSNELSNNNGSINNDLLTDEINKQSELLMNEISTRLTLAADETKEANDRNSSMLRNLDGRLKSHSGKVGTTIERLQNDVKSKVGEVELRDLHEKIKNENNDLGETVNGINSHLKSLTTKNDVQKMINLLKKKQEELSAIGVKCLVCNQNVPGGMQKKIPKGEFKRFPSPVGGHKLGHGLPTMNHQLSDLMSSPLRRAGALRQIRQSIGKSKTMHRSMPQDGYGPVGWSRIESNEAYVSRVIGNYPSDLEEKVQFSPLTGRKELKIKLKIQPRNIKSLPTFPELAASGSKTSIAAEYGLSVKKRSHLLRV